MYIFVSPKNYNLLHYYPALHRATNGSDHNISRAITTISKLGGKIYSIDQNYFSQVSNLTGNAKINFLESCCNS